ncbi:MAG: hypothetical protein QNL04_08535, partial [SAR324 cluster bacterium]|nr:hypothetical protein [SAR324 cluster bacterium]
MDYITEINFKCDGLIYRVYLDRISGSISFVLRGGATKKGTLKSPFFYGDAVEEYGDLDIVLNPTKVLVKVKKVVIAWIFEARPPTFNFYATTKRKAKIYR